ncbi:MAG: 1-aminocyclopropane-1-carboxylate deaminase/D-cysteine desulfhydrase [Chitinophagaceae bacterium]
MQEVDLSLAQVVPIQKKLYQQKEVTLSVLRLDLIHPIISGNKWFKLKEYLAEAERLQKKNIVTFGGAFSNHIVATAAAGHQKGLQTFGIIRGEHPAQLSHTLQQAEELGMQLHFTSREAYSLKTIPDAIAALKDTYVIAEGGYGAMGAQGASTMLDLVNKQEFTHIAAAVGTGTMLAGLLQAAAENQQIIGISVLKGYKALEDDVLKLIPTPKGNIKVLHDYHFGGYAKKTPALLQFMNDWFAQTGIPSDFVYTGKLFYAINDLIEKDYFPRGAQVLAIHSGGLQGNASLPKGTLIF